jgi:hypothetical protein
MGQPWTKEEDRPHEKQRLVKQNKAGKDSLTFIHGEFLKTMVT